MGLVAIETSLLPHTCQKTMRVATIMLKPADKQKSKQQPTPDLRLAKAFSFNGNDLAANRSGYLSWRQRGGWLTAVPHLLNQIVRRMLFGKHKTSNHPPDSVDSICGRARLEHYMVDRVGPRSTLFYEYFLLRLEGHDIRFPISTKQYHLLGENIVYRIYYDARDKHIYSLERVTDCEDAAL